MPLSWPLNVPCGKELQHHLPSCGGRLSMSPPSLSTLVWATPCHHSLPSLPCKERSSQLFTFPVIFRIQAIILSSLMWSCMYWNLFYPLSSLFSVLKMHYFFLSENLIVSFPDHLYTIRTCCFSFTAPAIVVSLLYLYAFLVTHFLSQATPRSIWHLKSTVSPDARIIPSID